MIGLYSPIKFVKGVGDKMADLLASELEIKTVLDLIYYFPFRYIDRSKFYKISELSDDLPYIQFKAKILNYRTDGQGYKQRLVATVG
ncbi:MAG: ATP-dependent DNA helicase RecG, partial [Bacteroidales bacterium]|nr:ATP-dependent DNA helicase RecG [Bacteroidales bacterium]